MKRVLTFILVLSMILGSIGAVFAAPALDDIAGTVYEKAVNRLALLEILEGYPDGTFKPDNTITRAEFAAVAVRAKGLKDAAIASEGLATGFTDVPASHWASGYINIATKLGLVNGMGDGTYAPEAPITYEQAVTLIVRTLGYEPSAQTKGGYPYGYLIVANEIELLDGVKGVQGAPAPRGIVAQITDNALEIAKMIQVGFGTDAKFVVSGSREHGDDTYPQYLLHDLGVDEVIGDLYETFRLEKSTLKKNEVKISDLRGDNKYNKYKITDDVDADALLGTGVTAWAKDDVIFAARVGYREKIGKIVYSFSEEQVKYDELTKSNKDEVTLTVLDDEYDWAARPVVYVNNKSVDAKDVGDGAWGRIVLDEDDDIEFAYLFKFDAGNSGIVTGIDKDDIEYVNLDAAEDVLALDKAKNVYVFNKDLSKAELDDIEEGTAIFYWKDKDDFYIVLTDEIVEGNLDAVRVSDSRVTVDGTNVSKAGDAIFSDNEMKDFKEWESYADIKDCVDEDVVVYKNLVGKAIALVTDAKAKSSKIYGIATWKTDARKPVLSVYTIEGKEIDYKFAETKDAAKASAQKADDGYEVVAFKLNKDGEIAKDEFEVISKAITFNKVDKDKFATDGTDGGNKYYLTKDTVILKALNSKGEIKPSVIGYDDIIKKTIDENNEAIIGTVKDKGNDLAVVVFIDSDFDAVDETEYGLVTGAPIRVGKNYEVEIDMVGKGVGDYILVEADANVDKGDLIKFTFNHKDEVDVEDSISSVKETGSKVTKKAGNYLTIDGEEYRVTSDTVYYATNKKGKLDGTTRLSKIKAGSWVVFLDNGKDELQVVVDVTAYVEESGVGPGGDDVEGGVVTYINKANYNTVFGRFDLEDKDGKALSLFTADFTGFKFKDASGEVAVSKTAMTAWLAAPANAAAVAAGKTIEVEDGKTLVMTVADADAAATAAIQLVVDAEQAKVDTAYDVPFGTLAADVDAVVKALVEKDVNTALVTVSVSGTTVTLKSTEDATVTKTATITVNKLGAISGKVDDGTNPVAGATVEITDGTDKFTATTAADGTYKIVDVPAGSYTGTVKAAGYLDGSITSLTVTAAIEATGTDVTLTKDTTAPTIDSVTGTAGSKDLTISMTEANALKDQVNKGAFTVTVNGIEVAVTNATIDTTAKTVTLTLETAVVSGNNVTVKYAPTGTNDIEDASGNKAITTIVSASIS